MCFIDKVVIWLGLLFVVIVYVNLNWLFIIVLYFFVVIVMWINIVIVENVVSFSFMFVMLLDLMFWVVLCSFVELLFFDKFINI